MGSNPVTVREAESAFRAAMSTLHPGGRHEPGKYCARCEALKAAWAAARAWVAAARAEAIEECAKVAEGHKHFEDGDLINQVGLEIDRRCGKFRDLEADCIAHAIRALARKGVEP